MLGYLDTWSAVRRCRARTGRDPLRLLAAPLADAWGDGSRDMRWPLDAEGRSRLSHGLVAGRNPSGAGCLIIRALPDWRLSECPCASCCPPSCAFHSPAPPWPTTRPAPLGLGHRPGRDGQGCAPAGRPVPLRERHLARQHAVPGGVRERRRRHHAVREGAGRRAGDPARGRGGGDKATPEMQRLGAMYAASWTRDGRGARHRAAQAAVRRDRGDRRPGGARALFRPRAEPRNQRPLGVYVYPGRAQFRATTSRTWTRTASACRTATTTSRPRTRTSNSGRSTSTISRSC